MNKKCTPPSLFGIILLIAIALSSLTAFSQPDYVFKNAVLVSGNDLQVGAVYRFSDVRPGTDALVTITDMKKITLGQLDGASGFDEAFQPVIECPGKSKGYVEFRFDFVAAGTNNLKVMTEVPVTAIDIDGWTFPDDKICENDEFYESPAYYVDYSTLGTNLSIGYDGNWVSAMNTSGITYNGVDTVQKDVMVSMVYANVSSITIRTGADNKSASSMERLRSDYFKKFNYNASTLLAAAALKEFSASLKNNRVNLQWSLNDKNNVTRVFIERSSSPSQFTTLGETAINTENNDYSFTDNSLNTAVTYYRLKLVNSLGAAKYSEVLVIRPETASRENFKMYPSLINDNATIRLESSKAEQTTLQVVDLNGRLVLQKQITLQQGINNLALNGFNILHQGTYVAYVKADNVAYSQKIMIQ